MNDQVAHDTFLAAGEQAHLRHILRWKIQMGKGWWLETKIKADDPLPPALQSLVDKGFAKATQHLVSGPLRAKSDRWGVVITDRGEVVARLLGLQNNAPTKS